jgi:predicted  nucleic acid-binding Zn-ribbon protein
LEREAEANERKIEILANEIRALESPGILDDALRRTGQLANSTRNSTPRSRLDEMRRELVELKSRTTSLNSEIRRLEL